MNATTTQTIAQFIKANGLTMKVEHGTKQPIPESFKTGADAWTCTIRMGRRQMTVPFFMGYGHNGKAPTLAGVLDCLASDASSVDNARSFEEWARDMGYDEDSRTAEKTYKACERGGERLKRLLGNDLYQALLYDTERE